MKSWSWEKHLHEAQSQRFFQKIVRWLVFPIYLILLVGCGVQDGKVVSLPDYKPIANAIVSHNGEVVHTDGEGRFHLKGVSFKKPLFVKALGFQPTTVALKQHSTLDIQLQPFAARALYLSQNGVGKDSIRDSVLQLLKDTDLNALVVDLKNTRGFISFSCDIPLGTKSGAFSNVTILNLSSFVQRCHEEKLYLIGRICVFKDTALATHQPDWAAIDSETKKPFQDTDKMIWMDPFQKSVWDYNIDLAKRAAEAGFDEIQFDFVRFPDPPGKRLKFSASEDTQGARAEAVTAFFKKAYEELASYNTCISAGILGSSIWGKGREKMGVNLKSVSSITDYLSFYLYPSDIPPAVVGLQTNSASVPREAVRAALELAIQSVPESRKIRPFLQHFKDYRQPDLEFKEEQVAQQIAACNEAQTGGWILFNADNKYPYAAGALRLQDQSGNREQAQR